MCDVVWRDRYSLKFVPHWLVTQEQIKTWDDDDDYDNDEIIEWTDGCYKRKVQKAKMKQDLMPIASHPDRVIDWCMSEDDKRRWK